MKRQIELNFNPSYKMSLGFKFGFDDVLEKKN